MGFGVKRRKREVPLDNLISGMTPPDGRWSHTLADWVGEPLPPAGVLKILGGGGVVRPPHPDFTHSTVRGGRAVVQGGADPSPGGFPSAMP